MRARYAWWSIVPVAMIMAAGGMALVSNQAVAGGNKVQSTVTVTQVAASGIVVSFTAKGALSSARSDVLGGGKEEIGCWTTDGQSISCLAVDSTGVQAACIVADSTHGADGTTSLGYMVRLAALNGDSFIQFSGVADDPADPFTSYSCTALRVENRSIYSPKQ